MAPKSSWLEPKVLVPSVVAVAAVVALVVVLAFGGSSGDSASSSAPSQSSTTTVAGAPTTAATGGVDDGGQGTSVPTPTTIAPGPYTTPTMPVRVDVPPVDGAIDGEAVTVHASPEPGSLLYGVEARLCRGDAAIPDARRGLHRQAPLGQLGFESPGGWIRTVHRNRSDLPGGRRNHDVRHAVQRPHLHHLRTGHPLPDRPQAPVSEGIRIQGNPCHLPLNLQFRRAAVPGSPPATKRI